MPLTGLESAVQTMVSCVVEYMCEKGTFKINECGLKKMLTEQGKHLLQPVDKKCPGVFELIMPLKGSCSFGGVPDVAKDVDAMTSKMYVKDNQLIIECRFR